MSSAARRHPWVMLALLAGCRRADTDTQHDAPVSSTRTVRPTAPSIAPATPSASSSSNEHVSDAGAVHRSIAQIGADGIARNAEHWLDYADAAKGVAIARHLDCERQDTVYEFRRVTGDAVRKALLPLFRAMRLRARQYGEAFPKARFTCTAKRFFECEVPPATECLSEFVVVFDRATTPARLLGVVERDDWQSMPHYRTRTDARIAALLDEVATDADGGRRPR